MDTLRVGIVGTGVMAKSCATVLAAHPNASVLAVAGRTAESAQRLAATLDAPAGRTEPAAFAGHEALLDAGLVDALVVATPDHAHADAVIAAATHGVHVLVEKPFTTDLAAADRAVAAIRAAGVVGMCLFNHRWIPAYTQAKNEMAAIGAPVVAYARKNDTIYVPTEMIGWAAETTCAWFLSSHDIDLVTWLFDDRVIEVFATARYGRLRGLGIDTPDAVQIQARFARGAMATFESAWIYPNTFPTMVDSYVSVVGERGVIQLDRQKENIQLATESGYSYPRNLLNRIVNGAPAGAYRDAVDHFVVCALEGKAPLPSVESSRDVTATLAAAHESIRIGKPVAVAELDVA